MTPRSRRTPVILRIARTPNGAAGLSILGLVVALAILGPVLWGEQASAIDSTLLAAGPSEGHILGTDTLGRDIFYRTLVAARTSLLLASLATAITVVAGLALGAAPSLVGRRAGRFLAGLISITVAFPSLLLVLFFAVLFGVTTTSAVLALGLAGAPSFARLVHTLSASIAGRDFVAAAAVAGVSKLRILLRHLVPNMGEQLAINIMLSMGGTLLSFAALSFLGIGVRAPDYDWGLLLNQGVAAIYRNPAGALAPAVAVIVAGLGFNLFGEGAGQVFGHQQTTLPYKTRPKALAARPDRRQAAGGDDLLVIENLSVSFPTPTGWLTPVRGVNLTIRTGESVGIVGESGAGKSLTALAAAALIERPGSVRADRLEFLGLSLTAPLGRHRRRELGTTMAMVFQDPMTSLNPSLRVGTQLTEGAIQHQGLRRRDALARALAKLKDVRLRRPEQRIGQYPHELSGGMRQRVMIAMGLMGSLKLLIADEPTTALDATVQAQVLDVIRDVRANEGAALMLVSHDIGVVTEACDRVLVMYAGRIIEDLPAAELFQGARHPYTRALLETVPDMESDTRAPLAVIPGRPPDPREFPPGCAFAARCALANETCLANDPVLERCGPDHLVACWHPLALTGEPSSAGQSEAVAA